jgi:hypothetical protein
MDDTSKDKAALNHYKASKPNHLGDLHQRMQYVMERVNMLGSLLEKHHHGGINIVFQELRDGACDLEAEIKHTRPLNLPNGRCDVYRGGKS